MSARPEPAAPLTGYQFRARRLELGLTANELGRLAGISPSTVARLERELDVTDHSRTKVLAALLRAGRQRGSGGAVG